ncbi:PfkB family carbohydrate kinase [Catenuloplanes indicus]|nr:PfkB family carbohydrate kinase [Catenuloplanes indicus]
MHVIVPGRIDQISLSFLVDELEVRRGGVAANIALGMRRLGATATLVAAAGRDFDAYAAWLEHHGVSTTHVRRSRHRHTARFLRRYTDECRRHRPPRHDLRMSASFRGPFVGVSAVVLRDGGVLLGRRRGTHGNGTWAFPGGKVDAGEEPAVTVGRELHEETGLRATRVVPIRWTSDLFPESGLHYVTLHHLVEADGEPELREPEKAYEWRWWADLERLPEPLFGPAAALWATGWRP